jgi:hypothetical protein
MPKCRTCGQRKGKRACPALGRLLCPVCCGQRRGREIACPPSCRFLAEHQPYQDRRTLERGSEPSPSDRSAQAVMGDERLAWLALNAEAPVREMAERDPRFTDGEAILALERAREKLGRGRSRLIVPGEERKPENAAAETILRSMDACRYDRAVILVGGSEGYTTEEKTRVLDVVIRAAKGWAGGEFGGRAYLDRLRDQFARLQTATPASRILAT